MTILGSLAVGVVGAARTTVLLLAVAAAYLLAPGGLGQAGGPIQHSRTAESIGLSAEQAGVSTISGRVTVRETGAPYPDAIVEFKNTTGGNVHATTDVNGEYSLQVPDDVYTALALDLNNTNAGFDAV